MIRKERAGYLDMLRVIACFFVIFNHLRGYTAYQTATEPVQAFYYMAYTMLTRINVPLFFMISGSLLLSRDVDYKELILKKILRIVIVLTAASLVVYLVRNRDNLSGLNAIVFLRKLLAGTHEASYWYLYAYLGFLVSLPLMRSIAKNLRSADFIWILVLHFIFTTFFPIFHYVCSARGIAYVAVSGDFNIPLMTFRAFFFPLTGYYIDRVFDVQKLTKKNIWIVAAIGLVGVFVPSLFTYHQGVTSGYTQGFVQTFDYVIAISVFLLVKCLFVKVDRVAHNVMLKKTVTLVGSLTFGIYLMDPVLKVAVKQFNAVVTTSDLILYSVCWCAFSMAVCGLATYLLKKLPCLKKLL